MSPEAAARPAARALRARAGRAVAAGGLAVTAAAAALVGAGAPARAQLERWVGPGGDCGGRTPCHASIQAAVDAAAAGEAIRVLPGAYTETVTAVDKPVVLMGPGGAAEPLDPARHATWAAPGGAALTVDGRTRDVAGVVVTGLRFRAAHAAIRLIGRRAGDPDGPPHGRPPSTLDTTISGARIADNAFERVGAGAPEPPAGPAPAAVEARYATDLRTQGNVVRDGRAGLDFLGSTGLLDGDRFERMALPAVRARLGPGELAVAGAVVLGAGPRALELTALPPRGGAAGTARVEGVRLEGGGGSGIHAEGLRGTLVISGVVATGMAGAGVELVDVADARMRASSLVANGEGVRIVESGPLPAGAPGVVLGGSPALGNDLGANLGSSVILERAPGTGSGGDVDARHNDWGAAWPDAIEARIQDGRDRPALGRVRWRPPLGAPEAVTVAVSPAMIPAGGALPAAVAARVVDAARRPVAGALVVLGAEPGTLDAPGAVVEAEAEAVAASGDWGLFKSQRFGPFRGQGYLQSGEAGDALGWSFQGGALAVRLAHSADRPGVASVVVDDGLPVLLDTTDDADRWVERLVATGLAGATHRVTLTLLSGQVAVDALAAGALSDAAGLVRADLAPAAGVGRGVVRAEAWGAAGMRTGEAAVEFVPGPPADVVVVAGSATIAVASGSTPVTATVRDALGRAVRDGTRVAFTTTLGVVTPTEAATLRGVARAVLVAGTQAGTARVDARADGPVGVAEVAIAPGPPERLALDVAPAQLTANGRDAARVTVVAQDAYGNGVADGTRVALTSTLGTLEVDGAPVAGEAGTRGGRVEATLRAGAVAGNADVRASIGALAESSAVALRAPDLRVRKVVEPESALVPGEWVTYTVTYRNEGPGAVYDAVLDDPMPPELVSRTLSIDGPVLSLAPGTAYRFHAARIGAGQEGTIQVRARIDPRRAWGVRTPITNTARLQSASAAEAAPGDNAASATILVVPMAVYSLTLAAPPSLPVGGATGEVVVRVVDRGGRPAPDDTPVDLSVDRGTVAPARVLTRGGAGRATLTTGRSAGWATVRALSLDGRGAFARTLILAGPPATMTLAAEPDWLPVGGLTATVTAALADQYGNPVAGADVELATTLGALVRLEGATDARGEITSTLRSGVRAGEARVTARTGTLARSVAVPFRPGAAARLTLELATARGILGVPVAARARVADAFDNPIPGQRVAFATTIGWMRADEAVTGPGGIAVAVVECSAAGQGIVEARLGDLSAQAPLAVGAPRAFVPLAQRGRGR